MMALPIMPAVVPRSVPQPERNAAYSCALHAYARGEGPNPQTQGQFFRERSRSTPAAG